MNFTDVYLSLNGIVIPNNGYVLISEIGFTDETALLCNTNIVPPDDQRYSETGWFAPDKTRIPEESNQAFLSSRDATVVRLKRKNNTHSLQQGIYICEVNATDPTQPLYVGLYHVNEGLQSIFAVHISMSFLYFRSGPHI